MSRAIAVDGHAPPADKYYLTDVTLQRATPLALGALLFPGHRLIPARDLVPSGIDNSEYQAILVDGMTESQSVAAVVAERAAGFNVATPPSRVYVRNFAGAQTPARRLLRTGDVVLAVNGVPIKTTAQIAQVVGRLRPGARASVDVVRAGSALRLDVPTVATAAGTRFGIVVAPKFLHPQLVVPVRFAIDDVSGSSGGLMFALDIYASLRRGTLPGGRAIAGTGTLNYDGTVGPIEGTVQKLIAAKRAGARIFFCPKENFADVRDERDVRIVPVGSFHEALQALGS